MKHGEFTYERLYNMFRSSLESGYRPALFGNEDSGPAPFILWRHDIDLELPAVVAMAELEARAGIQATYFLMTRSWFYNLFSWEGESTIRRLQELGHAIGLHCDLHLPREAPVDADEVEEKVAHEIRLVDAAFPGVFRRVVSFHNPPRGVLRQGYEGFYSTYQPKFFSDIKYLSDSNRHWREGPPEDWFDPSRTPQLSILLHPVIWAYPGTSMPEGMQSFLERRRERGRAALAADDVWV